VSAHTALRSIYARRKTTQATSNGRRVWKWKGAAPITHALPRCHCCCLSVARNAPGMVRCFRTTALCPIGIDSTDPAPQRRRAQPPPHTPHPTPHHPAPQSSMNDECLMPAQAAACPLPTAHCPLSTLCTTPLPSQWHHVACGHVVCVVSWYGARARSSKEQGASLMRHET
jgi:hypothetical protein